VPRKFTEPVCPVMSVVEQIISMASVHCKALDSSVRVQAENLAMHANGCWLLATSACTCMLVHCFQKARLADCDIAHLLHIESALDENSRSRAIISSLPLATSEADTHG
jgi:hypothetical protein